MTRLPTMLPRLRQIGCALLLTTGLSACASQMSAADRSAFTGQLDAGDYKGAAATAMSAGRVAPDGQTQNLVWSLNAGSTLFDAGDMKRSVAVLDTTEKLTRANDLSGMHAAIDYRYTTYDGVMTNTYKALAFLAQNDKDNARIEFGRADDRQRRGEESFAKEIAANQANLNRDAQFSAALKQAQQSPEFKDAQQHLGPLAAYAPFQNPFATYMAGLFYATNGDTDRGTYLIRRAAVMLGSNSPADQDLGWIHRAGDGRLPAQVWVVFENGQSALFHEQRIVLPMVTGQPMTLAMPILAQQPPAAPFLTVQAGGATLRTQPAGNFDAVMASEFQKRQPSIMAAAVAEVLAKNVAAMVAQKSNNGLLKLAVAVGANISNADTRSWTALPKEFQIVRINVPGDGKVALSDPSGRALGSVTVPAGESSIVYVKMQQAGAKPAIQVLHL